ncbi:MAG: hypothetical protein ACRC32_25640 [Chroococcidiopsis sp.]
MKTISIEQLILTQNRQYTRPKQWITFKVSELEMQALETYCQRTQRSKTNVLRETIRQLPTYSSFSKNS